MSRFRIPGLAAAALAGALVFAPASFAAVDEDIQWFTGARPAVEALEAPQLLTGAAAWSTGSEVASGIGDFWVGSTVAFGDARSTLQRGEAPLAALDPMSSSMMANAYVATEFWGLIPYAGVGIGATQQAEQLPLFHSVDPSFAPAYQGVAGLSLNLTSSLSTGVEYRYFATFGDTSVAPGVNADQPFQSHNVMLRIEYGF